MRTNARVGKMVVVGAALIAFGAGTVELAVSGVGKRVRTDVKINKNKSGPDGIQGKLESRIAGCEQRRRVHIRWRPDRDTKAIGLGSTKSNDRGKWRAEPLQGKLAPGQYKAIAPGKTIRRAAASGLAQESGHKLRCRKGRSRWVRAVDG